MGLEVDENIARVSIGVTNDAIQHKNFTELLIFVQLAAGVAPAAFLKIVLHGGIFDPELQRSWPRSRTFSFLERGMRRVLSLNAALIA